MSDENLDDQRPTRVLSPAPTALPDLPEDFGRYRLLRRVGDGETASFLVHDRQLSRDVILQVPRIAPGDEVTAVRRFLRAALAASTVHHPNLCPVLDAGEYQGVPYLTVPPLEGQTLAQQLRDGPMLPAEAALVVEKLARAMAAAHQKGVLHRDLTPACVLLTADGEPIISHFALARHQDASRLTLDGQVLGTPGHLAPERLAGADDSPHSDLYSLGVILYELLTGVPPFGRTLQEVLRSRGPETEPIAPSQRRPEVSPALDAICLKAMARTPQARQAGMAELADELQQFLQTATGTSAFVAMAAPPASGDVTQPSRHSGNWLVAVVAVSVVVMVTLAVVGWPRNAQEPPSIEPDEEDAPAMVSNPQGPPTPRQAKGLFAELYAGQFDHLLDVQDHPIIDLSSSNRPAARLPDGAHSIWWKGFLAAPNKGVYRLRFYVDDAVTLRVDGKRFLDEWRWREPGHFHEVEVEFGSRPISIEVKYYNVYGSYELQLEWRVPGGKGFVPVPASAFFHDPQMAAVARQRILTERPALNHNRHLAAWALGLGGQVVVRTAGERRAINKAADLPDGLFELDTLDLRGNPRAVDTELQQLFREANLHRLVLADTPAGDAALVCPGPLRLEHLDVARSQVTYAFLKEPFTNRWADLKSLDLSGTQVTDSALKELLSPVDDGKSGPRRGLLSLEILHLNDTAVTDKGLTSLSKLPRLRRLELRGTKTTAEGVKALLAALPPCQVER